MIKTHTQHPSLYTAVLAHVYTVYYPQNNCCQAIYKYVFAAALVKDMHSLVHINGCRTVATPNSQTRDTIAKEPSLSMFAAILNDTLIFSMRIQTSHMQNLANCSNVYVTVLCCPCHLTIDQAAQVAAGGTSLTGFYITFIICTKRKVSLNLWGL